MDAYHLKRRITLSFAGRNGRDYIAVAFGGDTSLRERLTREPWAFAGGGAVYIPADGFVLADFFDRYVGDAFIDYSAIKEPRPEPVRPPRPELPPGYLEKLRQVRYSDHTVRVYTTYYVPLNIKNFNVLNPCFSGYADMRHYILESARRAIDTAFSYGFICNGKRIKKSL